MNQALYITPSWAPQTNRKAPRRHNDGSMALIVILVALVVSCAGWAWAQDASAGTGAPDYEQLVSQATSQLKDGKLDEARQTVRGAILLNSTNYLGYAVEAKIAARQGKSSDARELVKAAIELAPAEEKDKVRQLAALLNSSAPVPDSSGPALSDDDQLKHDGLMRIVENATKAGDVEERKSLLRQFLAQSVEFADAHPDLVDVWIARAYGAVELDYPGEGWFAGKRLKALRATHHDDPKIREELVDVESKGWLGDKRTWRDWDKWTADQEIAAAQEGDAEAQFALGSDYFNGKKGLTRDLAEAAKWTRKAADQGNSVAESNLASDYINGWGVEKDYTEALKWARKSAEQGFTAGEYEMGLIYENGWGVDKDYAQAFDWYRQSTEQGDPEGETKLGVMFSNGWGVNRDDVEACGLFREAADQGYVTGEDNLGWSYENGRGVDRNLSEALTWYRKAAAQGSDYSKKALKRLNPDQQSSN